MKVIEGKRFSEERALYNTQHALIKNCRFEGEEDGESFLKESSDIEVRDCFMDLRYPLWHVSGLKMSGCELTPKCRAALWYVRDAQIEACSMNGIKALRECDGIELRNFSGESPEFGWKCRGMKVLKGRLVSEYAFLGSRDLTVEELDFTGKYSFQYTENVQIRDSKFKTKDAFWHSKNVTVRNSVIEGEYLGWYSENLTLIGCHLKGTQPLCYCKHLRLIDCTTEDFDLAFEYSDVEAELRGRVDSVKNPLSGRIVADGYGEIIRSDSKYPTSASIETKKSVP